jgi:hypothetical protein
MANDTLETVAGKINALTEKLSKASEDVRQYRSTRNVLVQEAHRRIVREKEIDTTFEQWCKDVQLQLTFQAAHKIAMLGYLQENPLVHKLTENSVESEEEACAAIQKEIAERANPRSEFPEVDKALARVFQFEGAARAYAEKRIMAEYGFIRETLVEAVRTIDTLAHKVTILEAEADRITPKDVAVQDVSYDLMPPSVPVDVTNLVRRYMDMPSKRVWLVQRFEDMMVGISPTLKGQGDASFQIVRDFEALDKANKQMVLTQIGRFEKEQF